MKKLLVICGLTATGKTSLAIHLAKKFKGELISADSRQVYKGMDIGTGKDLPENSKIQMTNDKLRFGNLNLGFYLIQGIRLWGYDLLEPDEEFSVAQYLKVARKIIRDIWGRNKLPILVGGTGLYIKAVTDGVPTASIPKNEKLRKKLDEREVDELFEKLAQMDPFKASSMNASDKKNPRRLIRAIEVALTNSKLKKEGSLREKNSKFEADTLFVGLNFPKDRLEKAIKNRAEKRLKQGLLLEIQDLLSQGIKWKDQSMQAFGYKEWEDYLSGHKEKEEVIKKWITNEKNYAKRQQAWFERNRSINWFDATSKNMRKNVEKLVKEWHNRTN